MGVNPFLGVILHAIGGFAAGTFYAPLRKVRRWGWESSWTVMAVAAWIVTPWLVARQTTPDLAGVLSDSDGKALALTFTFGVLWGIGGLTFGLTMRYLGMALGMAVALGLCATFGTLIPPIVRGRLGELAMTQSGQVVLVGIAVCIAGIVCCGLARRRKKSGRRSRNSPSGRDSPWRLSAAY